MVVVVWWGRSQINEAMEEAQWRRRNDGGGGTKAEPPRRCNGNGGRTGGCNNDVLEGRGRWKEARRQYVVVGKKKRNKQTK